METKKECCFLKHQCFLHMLAHPQYFNLPPHKQVEWLTKTFRFIALAPEIKEISTVLMAWHIYWMIFWHFLMIIFNKNPNFYKNRFFFNLFIDLYEKVSGDKILLWIVRHAKDGKNIKKKFFSPRSSGQKKCGQSNIHWKSRCKRKKCTVLKWIASIAMKMR